MTKSASGSIRDLTKIVKNNKKSKGADELSAIIDEDEDDEESALYFNVFKATPNKVGVNCTKSNANIKNNLATYKPINLTKISF